MRIKFLSIISAFLFVSLAITSCLDNDDDTIAYPTDATIQSFSINDIKTTITRPNDTIRFTVKGSKYPFNIDQSNLLIYNSDSLPVNTDVSKVSLNIATAGGPVYYQKNGKDTLWTTADSLNFTKANSMESALIFTAYSFNSQVSRKYKVWINVHKQAPDSLVWNQIKNADFQGSLVTGKQKAAILGNTMYVFAEVSSQVKVSSTLLNDGKNWTPFSSLDGVNGNADCSSVIAYDNKLFIVADGKVYLSEDGSNWRVTPSPQMKTLVTSFTNAPVSSTRLYAQDKRLIGISEDNFVQTVDGANWTVMNNVPENFPVSNFASSVAYPADTNSDVERSTVIGAIAGNDTAAVAWSILSNERSYIQLSPTRNSYYNCPKLENLSLIQYGGLLYAFGGKGINDTEIKAFQHFYSSGDNGLSWKEVIRNVFFPVEFLGRNENFSYIVDKDNYIWFMWSGTGEVWKGRINRLGFIK